MPQSSVKRSRDASTVGVETVFVGGVNPFIAAAPLRKKPIRAKYVQKISRGMILSVLDGALAYYVFDYCHPDWLHKPSYERLSMVKGLIPSNGNYYFIEHVDIEDYDALIAYEEQQLSLGFEGIMMRDPVGRYKNGRGTFNEGLIYKLKRFKDAEALIIGIEEGFKNENAQEKDELGFSKRSEKAEGLVRSGMAGRIIGYYNGQEIDIAPGAFTHDERIELLARRADNIGKTVKFRYMEHGMKDTAVLREQLLGVDQAYMHQLLRALENKEAGTRVDATYLAKLIDEIFE